MSERIISDSIFGMTEEGNNKAQHISLAELRVLIENLGCTEWVKIGYIKLDGKVEPIIARIVTENPPEIGRGSGIFVETGVDTPQFIKLDQIAYIKVQV